MTDSETRLDNLELSQTNQDTTISNIQTSINNLNLTSLTDCDILNPLDGQLLTYNQSLGIFQNQVKPTYTINEQTDFDSTIAKSNDDIMIYDQALQKWKPQSIVTEVINYVQGFCTIQVITMTNVNNLIPIYQSITGYTFQIVGDAFTVLTSTTLQINRTGTYVFNFSGQPTTNQSNIQLR